MSHPPLALRAYLVVETCVFWYQLYMYLPTLECRNDIMHMRSDQLIGKNESSLTYLLCMYTVHVYMTFTYMLVTSAQRQSLLHLHVHAVLYIYTVNVCIQFCWVIMCLVNLQIEDFLSGKSPLSVAIRVGESVVVVNLHRAKVEEIEMEPPPTKRRCVGSREIAVNEINYPDTSMTATQCSSIRHLNTNTSPNELMDTTEQSTSLQRRSSRLMERSLRSTRGVSPVSVCEPAPAMVLREPLPKVQEHPSIAALLGDSTLTESATATSPKKRTHECAIHRKYGQRGKSKVSGKFCPPHSEATSTECVSPLVSNSTRSNSELSSCKSQSSPGRSLSQATDSEPDYVRGSKGHSHSKRSKPSRYFARVW